MGKPNSPIVFYLRTTFDVIMFDFLSKEKKKIFLSYPFVRAFLKGELKEKKFLGDLKAFTPDLLSRGITKSDFTALENGIHLFKLERKKGRARENRLKKIVGKLMDLLKNAFPEEANNYEIMYEQIYKKSSMLGGTIKISLSESQAYGVFLILKSRPKSKYQIMHLFRKDLDAKKAVFEMMLNQIPSFKENLKKGIETIN